LGGGQALGDTTTIFMRDGTTLDLNNSVEAVGGLGVDTTNFSNGTIAVGSGALTINQTAASNFNGVFTGTGTLTKTGAATLIIDGASTGFTGTLNVNQGVLALGVQDVSGGRLSAAVININGGELFLDEDDASTINKLVDTVAINLNNTAGGNGFYYRGNDNATQSEKVGVITLGAGHNVIAAETTAASPGIADINAASLARQNMATALVRGTALGGSGAHGQIRFSTAVPAGSVGGGGAAGSLNISIVPYLVGDLTTTGLGNSLVTHVSTSVGLRPLAASEYTTDATQFNALTGASTNNVRFATNPSATLTSTATAINALVLDSARR
jgi:autotransporter-associated beta strand protein